MNNEEYDYICDETQRLLDEVRELWGLPAWKPDQLEEVCATYDARLAELKPATGV